MTDLYLWMSVAVIALTTAALRFLPFLIWHGGKPIPKLIAKLGETLPYAIIGTLVVYCLKDISFANPAGYLPSLIACAVVAFLYIWRHNTLISIAAGTVCYMLLVQWVF